RLTDLLFGEPQAVVRALGLSQIASNGRSAGNVAVRISNRRYRDRDDENAAVRAPALGLEGARALATADALQSSAYFIAPARRRQHIDRFAEHLANGMAEELFGGRVPAHD